MNIEERLEREKELIVLLLIIFAANDLDWWLSPFGPNRAWFRRQIVEKGIPEIIRNVSDSSQQRMILEIQREDLLDDQNIKRQIDQMDGFFADELADSLHRSHRNWLEKYERNEREGKALPELYPEWKAKRDAITKVTEVTSFTEERTRTGLKRHHNIDLMGQWKLDPFSNWCELCLALSDLYEPQWRAIYDSTPPRHASCRCSVGYSQVITSESPAPFRRQGEVFPLIEQPTGFDRLLLRI